MATVNSATSTIQTYEKNTDVKPKSEEKLEIKTDKAVSLSTNDRLQTYTVKTGDNLWNISKDKLGIPQKWPNIFDLNKDQIKDPNLIYPGQVFKLPLKDESNSEPEQPTNINPVQDDIKPIVDNTIVEPVKPIEEPKASENPTVINTEPPKQPIITTAPDSKPAEIVVSKNNISVKSTAIIGGSIGAAFTAGTLIGITAGLGKPLSNLGGYATAQIVAKNLGKVGLSFGNAAQVSKLVKSVGGPKVAGALAVVGVGVAVAGLTAGGVHLYNKISSNNL